MGLVASSQREDAPGLCLNDALHEGTSSLAVFAVSRAHTPCILTAMTGGVGSLLLGRDLPGYLLSVEKFIADLRRS
jgi:hypothetical protein